MSFRLLLASVVFALPVAASLPAPVDLRCDGATKRLNATAKPRLTWRLESDARGVKTTAWQVLVASSEEKLDADEGDRWDSGKTAARREPGTTYGGAPLSAGDRCFWKVRCWSGDGEPSPWSGAAVWEVAPLEAADWSGARWINDGRENPENDEDFYKDDPAPLMRHEFAISKPVVRARLHVVGLGLCYPSVNGERLDDHVFDPPWTDFAERIHFRTHDVTDLLAEGRHCLGLAVGNGWYNPLPLRMWGHRNIREALPVGRPRAIACLVVTHPDGSTTTVTTGDDWKTTPGPTLRNSIYLGEKRDARLAIDGWDRPGFDDSSWTKVRATDDTLDVLQPLDMPPARLKEAIPAKTVTTPAPDTHIVDFGVNLTALPEITLEAPAGTRIEFRFGELLHEDGSLNPMTSVCGQIKGTRKDKDGNEVLIGGPGAPEIAWQGDTYIVRGGGPEVFRPDFTFHAFRYMEVRGLPEAPAVADCRIFPLHTDLASAGSFSCSDETLNRIQEITRRTFLANVVTVQSDCPHRERFGYGGDIVVTSEAYLKNFDMHGFYAKTVRDWADAARPDGNFTDTAPFVGIQYCGVGWAMAHPLLLEQLHQHYGDRRLVEEQLPAAIRWFELEASKREDGLVVKGLGDHEALERIAGPVITTPMFIDTAYRMARLCRIVGREEDAARFTTMAAESASAWARAFFDEDTGKIGGGSQSEQALALGYGTLLDPARERVSDFLVADLKAKPDGPSLTTGIFGTRFLMEELTRNGHHELAWALATRESFPSWGWMLENGATTLWEDWEGTDGSKSHNHPMFGSISAWFFRWLGGIQCADDAVGFDLIEIRPRPVDGLEWVKCSHETIRGTIVSDWRIDGKRRTFEITIPADTRALIELPRRSGDRITEGGKPLDEVAGLDPVDAGDSFRMNAGSGSYRFEIAPEG